MSRPSPIPAPDRHQLENLNTLYRLDDAPRGGGWRALAKRQVGRLLSRVLSRQQHFNAAVVDHLNRNAAVGLEAHHATVKILDWVEQTVAIQGLDDLRRHREAMLAREQRANVAVSQLIAAHDELRSAVGALQHATHGLRQQIEQISGTGKASKASEVRGASGAGVATRSMGVGETTAMSLASGEDSHKYVGFEDAFRGSQDEIRERLTDYLPIFAGASDVLDIGCGRGEFLSLLRSQGITARGVDVNPTMIEVCQQQGLQATTADALSYLQGLPDGSLGGLLAAQVVEHLQPPYLSALLDAAFAKLRPGAPIVLETINPACWFAFFESYIRDITHVRPIHPDTLKYLLIATGFQRVEIRYRVPYPNEDKLQPVHASQTSLADWAETINANVEKINGLLFTWLDYAAVGYRP